MDKIKTSKDIDRRRLFVGTAALTAAAAQLGMIGAVVARPSKTKMPSVRPGSHTSCCFLARPARKWGGGLQLRCNPRSSIEACYTSSIGATISPALISRSFSASAAFVWSSCEL